MTQKQDLINALLDELENDISLRYIHYFHDEINNESVQDLIDILSNYKNIDLFISTPGGDAASMRVLIHFINTHPDIRIYMTGYIASAGTFLFIECNKEIILCEDLDWILFHMGDRPIEGSFRKTTLDHNILKEQLKNENEVWAKNFSNLGLNKKEIKMFLEGDDIVLYKKDFNRLKLN